MSPQYLGLEGPRPDTGEREKTGLIKIIGNGKAKEFHYKSTVLWECNIYLYLDRMRRDVSEGFDGYNLFWELIQNGKLSEFGKQLLNILIIHQ